MPASIATPEAAAIRWASPIAHPVLGTIALSTSSFHSWRERFRRPEVILRLGAEPGFETGHLETGHLETVNEFAHTTGLYGE